MDEIDQHILLELQLDGRISMTELSKRVGLSVPAVNERVKKLEDKGIILGYRAVINPTKVNKPITAFILFHTSKCDQFRALCKEEPYVIECHRLAGQFSYLVKVIAESVQDLEAFIDKAQPYGQSSTLITLSSTVEFKPFV